MDVQQLWEKVKAGLKSFWLWLKPYLQQFHRWRKRIWKKYHINKVLLLVAMVAILITSAYLYYLSKQVKVDNLKADMEATTEFYDGNNELVSEIHSQKGTYVSLDQISPLIQAAVVSTEDRTFYEHHGFDLKGIARAAVRAVIRRDTSGGGGSTITQQLAKNAYLTQDQTLSRKAKELFMAIEIEKKYTKDQILEMYLNHAYMGNGVWGMQDAARKYFGVNANEVDLGEAAMLVGILKGPNIYNPIDHPEYANDRRNTVLSVMADNGKITSDEANQVKATDITAYLNDTYEGTTDGYRYPYFYDAVLNEAEREYGLDDTDILTKGYKIYTTLDQNYQQQMDAVYANDGYFPAAAADGVIPQSGSVAIDPKTGAIRALVGRRGEHTFRGFNFATDMQRSPGSTIKPITVYTPALEAGYKPSSILQDHPLDYYDVKNYSGEYSGEVPMYQALANSLNAPAVWLTHELGMEKGMDKAKEFGLSLTEKDKYYGGVALGGLQKGESPKTMAAAYSVFANGGKYYRPHVISKIVDSKGTVIVDNTAPKGKRIISQETADEMTAMMLGTYSNGTSVYAAPYGYTVAGKTGTTETNFDATKVNDQWIIGYTPSVVISTWLGYENPDANHYLEGSSAEVAGQIFKAEAESILPYVPEYQFPVADAYATGGEVMAPSELRDKDDHDWNKTLDDLTDKTKNGLKDIGDRIKDGASKFFDDLKNKLNGN